MESFPNPTQLFPAMLAFLRIGAILFAMPIIGDPPTPTRARILAALALTIGIYPSLAANWSPRFDVEPIMIALYVIKELIIGITLGYTARVAFDSLMMAASVVAYQMGFGTAALFLPDYSEKLDPFSALHRMIIMLIFLSLGLHHIFFTAIAHSFTVIPGGTAQLNGSLATLLIEMSGNVLAIALQLAAPVLVALLFSMAALGLAARTVPNLNAFVMSFPTSFCVGAIVYIATLPLFPEWMRDHFTNLDNSLYNALHSLAP